MRVTGISLNSSKGEEPITFSLQSLDPLARYTIRDITGLDAEEIIPKFYGTGLNTKPKFYDFGLKPRTIVMRIELKPRFKLNESYGSIRDELYRLISASRTGAITLEFKSSGTTVAQAQGFIHKFESVTFTQTPEVQLTIMCNDPVLRGINPVVIAAEDLSIVNPVIVADSISTAPHGFHVHMIFNQASPTLTIQDVATTPDWKFKIVPVGGFLVGDILHIKTEFSDNHLHIERGANSIHLVDVVEPTSIWPMLFPGVNQFHIAEVIDGDFPFDWMDLEYYPAYWGV